MGAPTVGYGETHTGEHFMFKKPEIWIAIFLLIGSNIFMTFAWYGHLKFKDKALTLNDGLAFGLVIGAVATSLYQPF